MSDNAKVASLFAAAKAGSKSARHQLVLANKGLAALEARRAMPRARMHRWEEGDVMGAALEGLCLAVNGYDPTRGAAFSTYACKVIRGTIQTSLRTPRKVYAMDSFEAARETDGEDDTTLADTLPSTWMNQIELLTENPNPPDFMALAAKFLAQLTGREKDIFENKILNQHRSVTPAMLGCNNAARVSQIRAKLVAEFREFIASRE